MSTVKNIFDRVLVGYTCSLKLFFDKSVLLVPTYQY